ncbi:MAG: hypothetical protein JW726_07000 [Anaerolineales bacterium]|nr:hypothetical protein [Anaerolineales bacterium]
MSGINHRKPAVVNVWMLASLALAVVVRLILWLLYQPIAYSDSRSYRRLAESVLNGFERYDGTRTPGYPVFLALIGPDERVFIAQMLMGIVIVLLLFYITWKVTHKAWLAGLVSMMHTLNPGQLFFEANLLTETLATFWVVCSVAGMLLWLTMPANKRALWLAAAVGFTASLALITRPLFIYLPPWEFVFIAWIGWRMQDGHRKAQNNPLKAKIRYLVPQLAVFSLPVILIVGSWVGFIHSRFGDWGMTTMTGYHLMQHSGNFFELVPDQYADLRDTYLEYRDDHIAEYGTQTNTIWEAIPAMQEISGLNFYDLSSTLARISLQLILEHPALYLRNALKGWVLFWFAPVYWQPEFLAWQQGVPILQTGIMAARGLLVLCNILFILSSTLLALQAIFTKYRVITGLSIHGKTAPFFWFLSSTIWIASIIQTLLDHGDNPRFLIPLQSLVVLWVVWVASVIAPQLFKHKRLALAESEATNAEEDEN